MIKNIKLDATVDNWPVVFNFLDKHLTDAGVSAEQKTIIETAAEEIYVNIAHYAYGKGNGKAKIELDVSEAPFSVKLVFKDKGIPYNPLEKPDPDVTLSAEERGIGGLGIFMVKKSMDEVCYKYKYGQNIFTMVKNV